jgi:hypothetical protein
MAFGLTGAGTITKEQTLLSIRRIGVAATTTITKGQVVNADAGGDLITSTTTPVQGPHYVALETVDNSAGADGDLQCAVAVAGHYVTVIAGGVIRPGAYVQESTAVAGEVVTDAGGDDNLRVGIYFGKEGGTIAKAATTPFLEDFTDGADFVPADAADNDVIEILLVDN